MVTLTDLKDVLNICVPAAFMGVWGWWAIEAFTLIASYISTNAMGAQTILSMLSTLTCMFAMGFNWACKVMISKNIGSNNVLAIQHYFKITMIASLAVVVL